MKGPKLGGFGGTPARVAGRAPVLPPERPAGKARSLEPYFSDRLVGPGLRRTGRGVTFSFDPGGFVTSATDVRIFVFGTVPFQGVVDRFFIIGTFAGADQMWSVVYGRSLINSTVPIAVAAAMPRVIQPAVPDGFAFPGNLIRVIGVVQEYRPDFLLPEPGLQLGLVVFNSTGATRNLAGGIDVKEVVPAPLP